MPLLALFANVFSEQSSGTTLLTERCLRRRLNTNQCKRCLDICPSSALRLNGREIAFDETKCTGCMACVTACPQDALVSDYDLDELLCTLQKGRDVVVSCSRQKQNQPNEVVVPCVGIFSKQFLAAIVVNGCGPVTFNVAGCSECNNQKASTVFFADYKLVIETLSHIVCPGLILAHQSGSSQSAGEGRRSYLLNIKENILDVTKKSFIPDQKSPKYEKINSRRIPHKTKLVQNLLRDLSEDSRKRILSLFGYSLSVTRECTFCPLCKGICPTGAIKLEKSAQDKKITFKMLDCSGCGLCVEFCRKGALSLEKYPLQLS